jgi:hypothetical protein
MQHHQVGQIKYSEELQKGGGKFHRLFLLE